MPVSIAGGLHGPFDQFPTMVIKCEIHRRGIDLRGCTVADQAFFYQLKHLFFREHSGDPILPGASFHMLLKRVLMISSASRQFPSWFFSGAFIFKISAVPCWPIADPDITT